MAEETETAGETHCHMLPECGFLIKLYMEYFTAYKTGPYCMCNQQRLQPACASMQSENSICQATFVTGIFS